MGMSREKAIETLAIRAQWLEEHDRMIAQREHERALLLAFEGMTRARWVAEINALHAFLEGGDNAH